MSYAYAILKDNYEYLARESTIGQNDYKPTKYALIEKHCMPDHTEKIFQITYSDDLPGLSAEAEKFISWYNYPTEKTKGIQGFISDLP